MTTSKLSAALVAGILVATAPPAHAQLDARNRPDTRGPLATRRQFNDCQSRTERFNGEATARFRICYWHFVYDPARENSNHKNYAGFWAQATVTPLGRWCLRRARFDLELPRARFVHARAPRPGSVVRASRARPFTTRLKVDAQGHGDRNGFISNTFVVRPDRMAMTSPDGRTHRMAWSGDTGRTVAFASGVELSYRPGGQLPQVDPRVFASLARTGNC